jgi:hypothetical protein
VSEQPDFLAHSDALPFVLALRGDPDWKHAPQKSSGHKVSPLVLELWRVLDSAGALTAAAAREILGRELTEAVVLRALCELWQSLRISPVFAEEGQPASWEMLRVRHREALATGAATSQVTALSLLVSMYLQSVYAASTEEIEIFLSPVASRSRVREAVRGLSATRQIHSLSMDAQTYYFLEGGLPEFAEPALPTPPAAMAEPRRRPPQAEAGARSLPAPRPAQRKDYATRQVPAAPPAGRRTGPMPRQTPPLGASPGTDRKRGPSPQARAPWRPAGKPPASGPPRRWPGKSAVASGKVRPAAGSRPDLHRGARPDMRGGARPETRGGARPEKRPAPWPRPGGLPGSAPQAGDRADAPFRPAQKRLPAPGRVNERGRGEASFRRSPRGAGGPEEGRRAGSYRAPGRPQGPHTAAGNRPGFSGRPSGRPSAPFRAKEGRGGPPRGGRPGRSRPSRFGGQQAPGTPVPGVPGAGSPPDTRPGQSSRAGTNRDARYERPRQSGNAKSGAKSASGRGDKGGGPPFASRPAKSWPRAGNAPGKPGKPGFRGGKPARKKPSP